MVNKSSKLKQLNTLGLTALVLLGPFALYYVFYFSDQKSYFTSRDFRLLAVLSKQVEMKVDNIGGAYHKAAEAAATSTTLAVKAPASGRAVAGRVLKGSEIDEFLRPITEVGTTIKAATDAERLDSSILSKESNGKSFVSLSVKHEEGTSWLYFDYVDRRPEIPALPATQTKGTGLLIRAKSTFENLIGGFARKLVNPKDFDEVIITQENGVVVFQQGPPELNITSLDSLINRDPKNNDLNLSKQNSSVIDVQLANAGYKLFIQPVQLSLPASDGKTDQGVKWFVCGLVRSDHFLSESAAISYTVLIVLTFLLLFIALSTPFLKLLFMGCREKVRGAEVCFLFLSALMGSALLTILTLYGISYFDLARKMDTHLENLSDQIVTNFDAELRQANGELRRLTDRLLAKQLDGLDRQQKEVREQPVASSHLLANPETRPTDSDQRRLHNMLANLETTDGKKVTATNNDQDQTRKDNFGCPPLKLCLGKENILGSLVRYDDAYPYLNTAVWIDPEGQQRIKWTTKSMLASFFKVDDRAYFKNIAAQQTWECCKPDKATQGYSYFLEPVYSKATGGQQVILSTPMGNRHGETPNWVAALDFPALSLLQTVLPTDLGYGYCVINNEGNVLFHSDESRNLLEDFFAETDNDRYLRSVILARERKSLSVQYQGVGHRMFVRPIPDTPWTLVTFRDKKFLRTVELEVIAASIYLFVLYAVVLLGLSLHYLRRSENRDLLVWPNSELAPNYYLSIVSNLFFALAFGLSIALLNQWFVLVLAFIFPVLAFSFHLHNLKGGPKLERCRKAIRKLVERHTRLNYRKGYILTLVTLFLLTSVLPMLASFKFSYDREMRLFVSLGQINLARSLEDRAGRVREQYSQSFRESNGVARDAGVMKSFLEKRLNVDDSKVGENGPARDVYSRFFFNTNFQICDGKNKSPGCVKRSPKPENKFESFLSWILPFNNAISLRIHGLTSSMSGDEQSVWQQQNADSTGIINLSTNEKVDGDDDYEVLHVTSVAPLLGREQHGDWWIFLFAILAAVPCVLYILIGFIGRRIFLLDTDEPATLYGEGLCAEDISQNSLVLASSFTDRDELLVRKNFEIIDLRNMKRKSWDGVYNNQKQSGQELKPIALNYFECNRDDPKTNREKVRLLESLMVHNRRVVVLSSVDPTDYCFEQNGNGHGNGHSVNGSSAKLLSSLYRTYVEDKGHSESFLNQLEQVRKVWGERPDWKTNGERLLEVLQKECEPRVHLQKIGETLLSKSWLDSLTPEELISHVQEQANAYYHSIWETCSKDEKLTLCNLAKYHLLSSKNPDLPRLMKRGLISKGPHLRIMNDSFSRFIMAEGSPEKLVAWQGKGEGSSWEMLRVPFIIILICAAAFLCVSQRDLYDSTLAFVSAFAAGMPSLVKLFGLFQSGRVAGAGVP